MSESATTMPKSPMKGIIDGCATGDNCCILHPSEADEMGGTSLFPDLLRAASTLHV
jgi:hypothetical protein